MRLKQSQWTRINAPSPLRPRRHTKSRRMSNELARYASNMHMNSVYIPMNWIKMHWLFCVWARARVCLALIFNLSAHKFPPFLFPSSSFSYIVFSFSCAFYLFSRFPHFCKLFLVFHALSAPSLLLFRAHLLLRNHFTLQIVPFSNFPFALHRAPPAYYHISSFP